MTRIFRTHTPGTAGWVALALFVGGYAAMMALVLAPQAVLHPAATVVSDR